MGWEIYLLIAGVSIAGIWIAFRSVRSSAEDAGSSGERADQAEDDAEAAKRFQDRSQRWRDLPFAEQLKRLQDRKRRRASRTPRDS